MSDSEVSRRRFVLAAPVGANLLLLGSGAGAAQSGPGRRSTTATLFTELNREPIPAETRLLRTAGFARPSIGGADYAYDASVDRAFAQRHPRWSFVTSDGRGFRLSVDQQLNLDMFGALADDYGNQTVNPAPTDSYPAFQAAMEFLNYSKVTVAPGYNMLRELHVPFGLYYSSRTWHIKLGLTRLIGHGSRVRFPANTGGLVLHNYNTADEGEAPPGTNASGSLVRDIHFRGGGGEDRNHHGIWIRTTLCTFENVSVSNFPGNGWNCVADVTAKGRLAGNANINYIVNPVAERNGQHGMYFAGGDSNAFVVTKAHLQSNARWGILDASFLGNTHVGHHADSNGSVGAGTISHPNRTPALVSHGGRFYSVVVGQEEGAAANAPSGTQAHNSWWHYSQDGSPTQEIPAWRRGARYAAGGSYATTSAAGATTMVGMYQEGSQGIPQHVGTTILVGGLATPLRGAVHLRAVNGALTLAQLRVETTTSAGHQLLFEAAGAEVENGTVTTIGHSTYAPLGYRTTFPTRDYFFPFAYQGAARSNSFAITTPATTERFGTDQAKPHVLTVGQIAIGGRLMTSASAAPRSGSHAKGEVVWNDGSDPLSDGVDYWRCTRSGTPGTWVARP